LESAMRGGDVAAVQLRLKGASEAALGAAAARLAPPVRAHGASFILNDSPELAVRFDCDGVHVGQGDATAGAARAVVGSERIVGVTCHDSRDLAMSAAEAGADYVAFGAFFATATKATPYRPDLEILSIWQETMLTPCAAIGGISVENAAEVAAAGADFLAVAAGVWTWPAGPAEAVARLNAEIALGLARRPSGWTPPAG
jgi:thiamine-phosphate pyrophosphorylase